MPEVSNNPEVYCRPRLPAHLRCNGLFNNHFIANFIIPFAGERIYTIGEQLANLQAKCFIVFYNLCRIPRCTVPFVP